VQLDVDRSEPVLPAGELSETQAALSKESRVTSRQRLHASGTLAAEHFLQPSA
jgi:hypothetical protein